MQALRVEYLAIVEGTEEFCADVATFTHLLQADRRIRLQAEKLSFGGKEFVCEINPGQTDDKTNRFFHLTLCLDITKKDDFEGLLKAIRGLLFKLSKREPQILWDDVGRYYALKAYPIIHELENLMRKLITKFMLTKVGIAWTTEAVPKEVAESIKSKNIDSTYLYHVDFIQLSNFLFKQYSNKDTKAILHVIEKCTDSTTLKLNDLKQLIPRSNWDRYFSSVVKSEGEFIRVRWERLYELRNHVAHNRSLSRAEFDEINRLVGEIRPVIDHAISGFGSITLSEEERDSITQNAYASIDSMNGEYLSHWNALHLEILALAKKKCNPTTRVRLQDVKYPPNIRNLLNLLRADKIIHHTLRHEILDCYALRNMVLRNFVTLPEDQVHEHLRKLKSLSSQVALMMVGDERLPNAGNTVDLAHPSHEEENTSST